MIDLMYQSIYLMDMSLSSIQLEAFITVAQTLNFTKASGKLHISQSALSQRILNLEEDLQLTLFIRDRSGLKLTDHAQDLLRYCQTKNQMEEEFLTRVKSQNSNELAGVLRVGGFSSINRSVVLPSISEMLRKNPQVQLQMQTNEMYALPDLLKRSEIDYMLLYKKIDNEELERIDLGVEKNVLVRRKRYSGREVYLDQDELDTMTISYLKLTKVKYKKLQRHYLHDIYGILDGVLQGLGMAVLPLHLIENEKEIEIMSPSTILKASVSLYFYKRPFYSKLHEQFVNQLLENSKNILQKP